MTVVIADSTLREVLGTILYRKEIDKYSLQQGRKGYWVFQVEELEQMKFFDKERVVYERQQAMREV